MPLLQIAQIALSHPIALVVGLAFLSLQLVTFCLLWSWLKRQIVAVRQGRAGNEDSIARAARDDFGWPKWAVDCFRPRATSNFSRDDALKDLDRLLADERRHTALQRLAVMAPLLGVLITAAGFLTLKLPTDVERLDEILSVASPLIIGVGYGALLATINQVLLYLADSKVDQLRSLARDWFDDAIWRHVIAGPGAAETHAAVAFESLALEIRTAAEQFDLGAHAIQGVTGILGQTASALQLTLSGFLAELHALPGAFSDLTHANLSIARTLEAFVPIGSQAATGFDLAVGSFRQTVDENLARVAEHQKNGADRLAQTASQISDIVVKMAHAATSIEDNSRSQHEAANRFSESVTQCLVPQQAVVLDAVQRIESSTAALSARLEGISASLGQFVEQASGLFAAADATLKQLGGTAANFQQVVESQLDPAARLHRTTMELMSVTVDRTERAVGDLEGACAKLGTAATAQASAGMRLNESVIAHAVPAHELLAHATRSFDRTAEELSEHVDRLRSSIQGADGSINALLPLARQTINSMPGAVASFQKVVEQQFAPAAMRHRELLVEVGSSVEQLTKSLGGLQQATKTLSEGVERHAVAGDKFAPACQAIQTAASQLAQMARSLSNSVDADVVPAQHSLHAAVDSLTHSAGSLASFIETGVGPATKKLHELQSTVAALGASLNDMRSLAAMGRDASRFLEGLSRAARVADVLEDLPERLSESLRKPLDELKHVLSVPRAPRKTDGKPPGGISKWSIFGKRRNK